VNAFVAGFIGNPPMNLLPGRVVGAEHGALRVEVAAGRLTLATDGLAASLPPGPVTVGIRPEALTLAAADAADAIRFTVEHVEWLGHETLAHLRSGADTTGVVVRLPGMHALAAGQTVALTADPERVHLFDSQGRTLSR
jgi:ABC-type sugar transport system ATPase subunit